MKTFTRLSLMFLILAFSTGAAMAQAARTPVVIFPAFHFTKLVVTVENQTAFPECPASGTFEDWYTADNSGSAFSQVCQDKLETLIYDADPSKPMAERFSNQPGVTVGIKDFGTTESAPFYEDLYAFLEGAGYVRNQDIRVAGYDARLTPDMDGFLERSIALIEDTYRDNGNRPVHLIGHSNGPLYAQYLLTHTDRKWKDKYIHGFTPLAGNWPGQGFLYMVFFSGFNVSSFTFPATEANALSSARMFETHPSSYMSAADPAVFGNQEIVIKSMGTSYTPQDNLQLFADAGLTLAGTLAPYYTGFVKFADPANFPNVDVYAEKGSGFETPVGAKLPTLTVGQVLNLKNPTTFFVRDGDWNQEDITNDSIQVWDNMACHRFALTDNPGVDHFSIVSNPAVLQRLLANLQRTKSVCP